jgi:hypothetical protein
MRESFEEYLQRLKDRRTEDDYKYTDEDFSKYEEYIRDCWLTNLSVYKCLEFMYFAEEETHGELFNKETTKCYCGHTTYCDCGPEEATVNIFIEGFLFRNGFSKLKIRKDIYQDNIYHNSECTVIVHDNYYEIQFDQPEVGEVIMYTDSWSIMHLVGLLTWYDLIDKNYNK